MMARTKVLLVAVGGFGRVYLDEMIQHDTGAEIAGICEVMPNIEERIPVIRERNIPVYPDLESFYAEQSADLAVIATPVHFHASMVLTCLAHGTHVLCEKPLCVTEEEAHDMEVASCASKHFLAVGYQYNYRGDVLALKQDILSGRFGMPKRMQIVHAVRRGHKYYTRNNWAGRIAVDGREVLDSPFANACAHCFQMMTFLLGCDLRSACDVIGVEGELYHANPDAENYDIATVRFQTETGVPVFYYTAHPIYTLNFGPKGIFEFEHATITFDENASESFLVHLEDGTVLDYSDVPVGSQLKKLYDAIDCVRNGGTPVCGVSAELPHLHAVRMLQALPVHDVTQARIRHMEIAGDIFLYVQGLEYVFEECARAWALPRELGMVLDVPE